MIAYTDYPFPELGDAPGQKAPTREVRVSAYDGDKYCMVFVDGVECLITSGYLYDSISLSGPPVSHEKLMVVMNKWAHI